MKNKIKRAAGRLALVTKVKIRHALHALGRPYQERPQYTDGTAMDRSDARLMLACDAVLAVTALLVVALVFGAALS